MELGEERYPEPPLLPVDPLDRALARLYVWNHDTAFTNAYYAARRGEDGADERLAGNLDALDSTLAASALPQRLRVRLRRHRLVPRPPRAQAYLDLDLG